MAHKVKQVFRKRTERLPKAYRTRKERNRAKGVVCYECDHTWNTNPNTKRLTCPSKKHKMIHNALKRLYWKRNKGPLTREEELFIKRYTANTVDETKPRRQIAKTRQEIAAVD